MGLSDLLGRAVIEGHGPRIGCLRDLVVGVAGADPPLVVGLLIRRARRDLILPIGEVGLLAPRTTRAVLGASSPITVPCARRVGQMLLGRDMMGSRMLHRRGVRAVRVTDVLLAESAEADWLVTGIDSSLRARWRRVLARRRAQARGAGRPVVWTDLAPLTPGAGHG